MPDKEIAPLNLAGAVHNAQPEYHPSESSKKFLRISIKKAKGNSPLTLEEENFILIYSKNLNEYAYDAQRGNDILEEP